MRVGLIVPGFSAGDDDWCIPALLDLVRALSHAHDLEVFALRYPPVAGSYAAGGARVHAVGGGDIAGLRRLSLLRRAAGAVAARHRAAPFDLLHGLWADEPGYVATSLARRLGVPSVVSALGGELIDLPDIGYGGRRSRLNRWLAGRALARADRVTTGSTFLERIVAGQVDASRLTRLPLGIDPDLFRPEGLAVALDGDPALLAVGSLVPVKDHRTLLRAVAIAAGALPDIHLHLAGDGPEREALMLAASTLGISGRVTFHGAVPHERLPALYRSAKFCVLSSRYESQSLVVLEAAACGRTTVGTAVGLLPELLDADCLAAPADANGLARAIVALATDPDRRSAAERRLEDAVAERFTVAHTASGLDRLYHDLARPAALHKQIASCRGGDGNARRKPGGDRPLGAVARDERGRDDGQRPGPQRAGQHQQPRPLDRIGQQERGGAQQVDQEGRQ